MSWRIAAMALLGTGLLAGERAAGVAARRTMVVAAGFGFAVWAVIVAGSNRAPRLDSEVADPPSPTQRAVPLPLLDVVIPARDEASPLPQLLRDLGAQNHRDLDGRPRFTVIMVDDRSTDGTSMAAAAAADRAGLGRCFHVVSRPLGARPDGKGAALAAVPGSLLGGAAIVILDADARIAPDFLLRAAAWVASGTPAITARRRIRHGDAGRLAAAQAAEQTLDGLQLRGRAAFGGFGELRGNGMVLNPAVLDSAGGWPAGSLTEDLELSMRLAAQGIPIAWGADLVVWEAPTATIAALIRQRLRWAEGSVRRFFLLLLAVLASECLPMAAKVDLVGSTAQLVFPQFLAGVALGGIRQRNLTVFAIVGGVFVGVATCLTWVALGQEALFDKRVMPARARFARSVLGGSIETLWLVVLPLALVRIVIQIGPTTYAKTRERLL